MAEALHDPAAGEVFVAPTSFAQQRLWLLNVQQPGLPIYNVPVALRLRGPLSGRLLAAALAAVTARHETLRTAFAEEDGEPVQLIHERLAPVLAVADLTALPAAVREREAHAQLLAASLLPFDLTRAPLLHSLLVRLAPAEHLLLLNLHHIITDAWSLGILGREIFAVYEAAAAGRAPDLSPLAIQYADYAAWQRQWLVGEALERKLDVWRERLAGAPATLALPADRPRPRLPATAGGSLPFTLSAGIAAALPRLARDGEATQFMVLLAAFSALLGRLSGQEDFVLGAPVAGRNRVETENVVGCFVNTVALRCDLSGNPAWRALLARTAAMAIEAFARDDLPFEQLVAALRPDRRLNENPLFQVAIGFQQGALTAFTAGGLELLDPVPVHTGTAKFDLYLDLVGETTGIGGFWEYSTALFDPPTIGRLARQLEVLLAAVAAAPERPFLDLPLLGEAERHQLVLEWNEAAAARPEAASLAALFARRAAERPDAVAVTSGSGGLAVSYGELARRAASLADRLRQAGEWGAATEPVVGVYLERGVTMIEALLAVVSLGAAYLPLDPSYPVERLRFMAADAGARAVVTRRPLGAWLPAGLPVVWVGAREAHGEAESAGRAPMEAGTAGAAAIPADPSRLAYVIYTSGSTGVPKGVAVPQGAVVRLVRQSNFVQLGADDVVAQAANASFDAATFEIWGALLNGGRLAVVPREVMLAPERLVERLREEGVTALFLTTAVVHWLAGVAPGGLRSVRQVLFGGEAVDPSRVAEMQTGGGPRRLLHVYGPTENTTFSTYAVVAEVPAGAVTLPIGGPLTGGSVHLLDLLEGERRPVPVGVVGEVYLGGSGLARGYVGRPELTAERFVPDPLAGAAGARLYRTGDLARRRADGAVEFVGRLDSQVKIRGFRIEPAEVEAALGAHPGVAECVVLARRAGSGNGAGGGGELALAAYVVPRAGAAGRTAELRGWLQGKLPPHLVPSWFVELARLPRNENGKLDREALPEPGGRAQNAAGFVAPRTPTEELLAGIWTTVLRSERVGRHDNFFDLGGHSLTATRVTALVRTAFQVELPARAPFEAPVLADLAERIDRLSQAARGVELPPILPVPRGPAAPLSFAQQRLWFADELAGGTTPFYNIATALRLGGPLDHAVLAAALAAIHRRHEALRTTFEIGGDRRPVQIVHPAGRFALLLVDLSGLPALPRQAAARALLRQEARRPFALGRGPLLRVSLLRLEAERHTLSLTLHHIIADGWSLDLLMRELSALYNLFAGRPAGGWLPGADPGTLAGLPGLPVQYADFALWQRQWLAGAALAPQLAYWRRQLAGAPPVLELPADRPRPPLPSFGDGQVNFQLPGAWIDALRLQAREQRATLFMALLAAFAALLSRLSGQQDLCVGSPVANRGRAEVEGLIGFFVNLLVLRADLAAGPSFTQLLGRLRETALGAYTHQDLPFERLVEELQPARDLSRNPLFQASFSLTGLGWQTLDLPGLAAGLAETGTHAELFDLSLRVTEARLGWGARLSFNPDIFDRASALRIAGQLERLLDGIVAGPETPLAELPLLTPGERHQLEVERPAAALPTAGPAAAAPPPSGGPETAAPAATLAPAVPGAPAAAGPPAAGAATLAAVEDLVTGIWRDLLEIEEIGLDDNFFDLGGHSMLMGVVRVQLQEALGGELSMVDLFNHPTVRTLAAFLVHERTGAPAAAPAGEGTESVAPAAVAGSAPPLSTTEAAAVAAGPGAAPAPPAGVVASEALGRAAVESAAAAPPPGQAPASPAVPAAVPAGVPVSAAPAPVAIPSPAAVPMPAAPAPAAVLRPAAAAPASATGVGPVPAAAAVPAAAPAVAPIAIVGMAGRFPGARDLDELWRNLRDGVESITFFGDGGGRNGWAPPPASTVHHVPAAGILDGADLWDAGFFGLSAREAELMDPQHRLFLECAWQALEHAGCDPGRYPGTVGVFGGAGKNDYFLMLAASGAMDDFVGGQLAEFGNDRNFLTTRVSYELGLEGPSLNVQTGCSTSLVAVHLACQSLRSGECDLALAGGVSVRSDPEGGYFYREGGILSPDGRCRPFDVHAAGTVDSDGIGVVALKRLDAALAAGDAIHAVILGSAVNNDGSGKVGFTAPRTATQTRLVRAALAQAGVPAASIGLLEAHGTATPLGDPIEVSALTAAFRAETGARGFCALGSIKGNIGHTNTAAAAAGLLKAVLALEHRQLPPSLHFTAPNPELRLLESPFYVNDRLRDWPAAAGPRRAGVSSFGVGGTNAHVVLEEAPAPPPPAPARPWQLLTLSARSAPALEQAATEMTAWCERRGGLDAAALADVAFTLQTGRRAFGYRRIVLCRDGDGAVAALAGLDPERTAAGEAPRRAPAVAFLFPGQGAEHPGMAAGLHRDEPVFRAELDRCRALLAPHLDADPGAFLLSPPAASAPGAAGAVAEGLDRTELAPPALFAVEYALARTWMSWGVTPRAMLGHGLGEYVAACLAGVLSLPDALALAVERGRLLAGLPGGVVLAVPLSPADLAPLLGEELAIAAHNAPARSVVAGPAAAVAALEERLARLQLGSRRLAGPPAFHSPLLEPLLDRFAAAVARVELRPPSIPYLSNVTGRWIEAAEATDPRYWVRQLRQTVQFAAGLERLLAEPPHLLLEVGPGRTLASIAGIARREPAGGAAPPPPPVLASLPRPGDGAPDRAAMLLALGRLWLAGVAVDWPALHAGEARRRVPLPTYPFERRRHWVERPGQAGPAVSRGLPPGQVLVPGTATATPGAPAAAGAAARPAAVVPAAAAPDRAAASRQPHPAASGMTAHGGGPPPAAPETEDLATVAASGPEPAGAPQLLRGQRGG